jgi:hypothetical protein
MRAVGWSTAEPKTKGREKRARTRSGGGGKENTSERENRNRSIWPAENPNKAQKYFIAPG